MPPLCPSPGSRRDGPAAKKSSPNNGRGEGTCIHPHLARGMCRYSLRRVSAKKSPPKLIPKGCCKVKLLPLTPLPSVPGATCHIAPVGTSTVSGSYAPFRLDAHLPWVMPKGNISGNEQLPECERGAFSGAPTPTNDDVCAPTQRTRNDDTNGDSFWVLRRTDSVCFDAD